MRVSEYASGCLNLCNWWIILWDFLWVSVRAAVQFVWSGSVGGLSTPLEQLCDYWAPVWASTAGANLSLAFPHKSWLCCCPNNGETTGYLRSGRWWKQRHAARSFTLSETAISICKLQLKCLPRLSLGSRSFDKFMSNFTQTEVTVILHFSEQIYYESRRGGTWDHHRWSKRGIVLLFISMMNHLYLNRQKHSWHFLVAMEKLCRNFSVLA